LPLRIELAMTLKAVFPDVWALHPAGRERPRGPLGTVEAISSRNILILARYTSFLRPIGMSC
jgi:hypothetical protein